jgi:xylulokinase
MQPLHPCLIWMDRRASAEVDWVRKTVDIDRLARITGNGVDSYYGYTKMLWLRNQRPDVFRNTRWFLPPNAYVIHALTGELAVDRSSAGNIGGVYDMAAGGWSEEMLEALGIPAAMMPARLVGSSDVVGGLTASAAASRGLPAGTPVVAGGVDAAVATLAAGVTRAGQHAAMIGSSMCWGYISQAVDARHGLVSMPHVFGGPQDSYVFGGAITAGAAVTWFRDHFCRDITAEALGRGVDVHDLLDAEARDVPEGSEGVLFLPYLMGERSPVWDGKASGAFVGLSLYHQRRHLYRAVLEGVTFALRHNIEAGAQGTATLDDELIVVGGAARSDLWMQIIADVTGRPVLTIEQDVEAAMGAALLAAFGVGLVSAEEVRRGWVTLAPRATPRPGATKIYDGMFASYKALYPALKGTLHKLHDQRAIGPG